MSFPVAMAALLCGLAALTVRGRFSDPDLWWHLKTGQFIWTTHSIPAIDLFSFTAPHKAWIPHEWLAQAAIYSAYRSGGYSGLMLAFWLLASAVLVSGYALCSLYSGNAKVAFVGSLALFVFATTGFSIRPQLLGYLLLIVEMILLHLGRTRDRRWFLALPPLFAVWINCHGSFLLGIVVVAALLGSSVVQFRAGALVAKRWDARTRNWLIVAFVLSLAALLLNPTGINQVLYPLDTMLHQPINLSSVEEWQPLALNSQRGVCLLAVLAGIVLLALMRKAELHFDELILLGLGIWLAGSHIRLCFVFGILAAPILSRMMATSWENYNAAADRQWPNALLIALSVLVTFLAFPSRQNIADQIAEQNPAKAVEFLRAHHFSGPMLNEYRYGGYLIWAAPEYPVFIDGRADLYEWAGVLAEFNRWSTLQENPNRLLDRYGIQFCLLSPNSPMAQVLPLLPNWKAIYSDRNAILFERTPIESPSHQLTR